MAQAGPLTDGLGSVDFGTVTVGTPSAAKIFTLTNSGNGDLTSLAVSIDGANAADITVSALSATSVAVGAGTATFSVTCNPAGSGAKTAAIHIASNVTGTQNPFDIALSAIGNSAPTFAGYAAGTPYQTAAGISLGKLLASTADAEGDALSVTAAGASAQGGTAVVQAGSILSTPAAGFSGSDSFPVTISDARGASVVGTVSVTVQADSGLAGGGATNPPVLHVLPGGSIQLAFAGIPGRSYEIQRSSDLNNWLVATAIPDNSDVGFSDTRSLSVPDITEIQNLTVELNFSGGCSGDLYAYLVHDGGFSVLLNRPGRSLLNPDGSAASSLDVTFDDAAPTDIHLAIPMTGGALGLYQPDGRATDPLLVEAGDPRGAMLSSFTGLDASGAWTLFVANQAAGSTATLQSWSLSVTGVPEPATPLIGGLGLLLALRRRRATV